MQGAHGPLKAVNECSSQQGTMYMCMEPGAHNGAVVPSLPLCALDGAHEPPKAAKECLTW